MSFEERMNEWLRKGNIDKVKYFENLHKNIQPSIVEKIQRNDKSVLTETVFPDWVKWDLLREWALTKKIKEQGANCILCNEDSELGIIFKEKWICESCFLKLKHMDYHPKDETKLDLTKFKG